MECGIDLNALYNEITANGKTIKGDSMQVQTYWISTQDKQKLYAKTWGNAENPALVLVHGYPDNQEVWEPIIEQLISKFYIITYECTWGRAVFCTKTNS